MKFNKPVICLGRKAMLQFMKKYKLVARMRKMRIVPRHSIHGRVYKINGIIRHCPDKYLQIGRWIKCGKSHVTK